ncbi:WD40 repeat protein [Saccharothrix ecbatanensis]|uniref:WD40 repeat protein n=1 Tax=Saccharothrix ecbatanensis TaxID=1105145 RepID=A0A7W9M0Z1_9PSEU|nr:TIR domain-containing protein [Saccharothrix ecbatanensis]MBB5803425.1 WD40 repeat protein [Saccharothrix ecbatanensis]
MARVFISYATADLATAGEVSTWLLGKGHKTFLAAEHPIGIKPGEDWKQVLYDELRRVDAVVCVVTRAFATSSWCAAEVGIADSLGCLLLPLLAEPDVDHQLLRHLQHVDLSAGPAEARAKLLEQLRALDRRGRPRWREGDNPYPGLEPFTAELSAMFTGRDDDSDKLDRWLRRPADNGLLAIVGPSGSGKSSLLRAGLLPRLDRGPGRLVLDPWTPGDDPLGELTESLAVHAHRLGLTPEEVRAPRGPRLATKRLAKVRRPLIAIDQAEELFTRSPVDARAELAVVLLDAVEHGARVVLTLRSEFLDDLIALIGTRFDTHTLVPLRPGDLEDAVTKPARLAGLEVEQGLAARLVADTGHALPLLAYTLNHLAEGLKRGDTLSLKRYDGGRSVREFFTRKAGDALDRATTRAGLTADEVLSGLVNLVADDNGRLGRRRVRLDTLPGPLRVALGVFVDQRLLTATDDGWVEPAHEALFTDWTPLRDALERRARTLTTARSVERAADEWHRAGRPDSHLWDADRALATLSVLGLPTDRPLADPPSAGRLPAGPAPPADPPTADPAPDETTDLDRHGREFLAAVLDRLHHTRRRVHRRRRRTLATLSFLLVLAVAATVVAAVQWRTARDQRDSATAYALLSQAEAARGSSPRLALRLALAAHHLRPDAEAIANLVDTLTTTRYGGTLANDSGGAASTAISPDGRILATGGANGEVVLWDRTDPDRPRLRDQPITLDHPVAEVAFPARGDLVLAVGDSDGGVGLWDVSGTPTLRHRIPGDRPVTALAQDPEGRTLAVGSPDGAVELWDTTDPHHPAARATLRGHTSRVSSLAFSPGGTLATGSDDGTAILWDTSDPAAPARRGDPLTDGTRRPITSLALSPTGDLLLTGRSDGTVDLWDTATLQSLGTPLTGHNGVVSAVAFTSGTAAATGGDDGTAILWDLTDRTRPRRSGPPLVGHLGPVTSLSPGPGGDPLATTGAAGEIVLWDLVERPRRLGEPLTAHEKLVDSVVFDGTELITTGADGKRLHWDVTDPVNPDLLSHDRSGDDLRRPFGVHGNIDATLGSDNTVLLWDITDPVHPRRLGRPLEGHRGTVTALAFSADGCTVAVGASDGVTILWDISDVTDPHRLGQPLLVPSAQVTALAFAPDSTTIAVGDSRGAITLWDHGDPNRPRRLGEPLAGHRMAVNAVAFSPDGDVLATGGSDGAVLLWETDPVTDPVGRACAVAGGGLVPDEWQQYLPDLPHQQTCPGQEAPR